MLPLSRGKAVLCPLQPEAWLRAPKAQAWLAHSKNSSWRTDFVHEPKSLVAFFDFFSA